MSKLIAVYAPLVKSGVLSGIYKPPLHTLFRRATTLPVHDPPEKEFKVNDSVTVVATCFFELYGAILEARYPTVPLLFLPDKMFRKMTPVIEEMRKNKNRLMSTSLTRQRLREYVDSPLQTIEAVAVLTRSVNLRFTAAVLKDLQFPATQIMTLFTKEELVIFKQPTRTLNTDELAFIHHNNTTVVNDNSADLNLSIEETFLTKLYQKCISTSS